MGTVVTFSTWLHGTRLSWAVAGGYPWLWPALETLHFLGMALLIGIVGLLDLRLVGCFKGLPVGPLERLIPWGILGFAINLVTGFLFFTGDPFQYIRNVAFWLKLGFMAAAGVNAFVFYATGLSARVDATGAGQEAPFAARLVGGVSLILWIGVMYWGRMLPFIGNAF